VVPGQEPIYQNLPLHEKLNQSYTGEEEEELEEIPIGEIFFLMPLISTIIIDIFLKSWFLPVHVQAYTGTVCINLFLKLSNDTWILALINEPVSTFLVVEKSINTSGISIV
jgi:hypothetical protein